MLQRNKGCIVTKVELILYVSLIRGSFVLTELDQLISKAFASEGAQEDVNKVYLALLRTKLFVPVGKMFSPKNTEELPKPLFAKLDDKYFMLVFDQLDRLTTWAGDEFSQMDYVAIFWNLEIIYLLRNDIIIELVKTKLFTNIIITVVRLFLYRLDVN